MSKLDLQNVQEGGREEQNRPPHPDQAHGRDLLLPLLQPHQRQRGGEAGAHPPRPRPQVEVQGDPRNEGAARQLDRSIDPPAVKRTLSYLGVISI